MAPSFIGRALPHVWLTLAKGPYFGAPALTSWLLPYFGLRLVTVAGLRSRAPTHSGGQPELWLLSYNETLLLTKAIF